MKSKEANTYNCIVTGAPKYIPPSLAKKQFIRFGSADEFKKHYVSREARKMLKQGMSVKDIRDKLNCSDDLSDVGIDILIKLKLVKLHTRKGRKEANEAKERARYLNSQEFKDKKRRIATERDNMSYAEWVEENTGIGKERGGTCIRPDVFLSWNNRACDGCEAYDFCVCYSKRLSHEPRKKRRR